MLIRARTRSRVTRVCSTALALVAEAGIGASAISRHWRARGPGDGFPGGHGLRLCDPPAGLLRVARAGAAMAAAFVVRRRGCRRPIIDPLLFAHPRAVGIGFILVLLSWLIGRCWSISRLKS